MDTDRPIYIAKTHPFKRHNYILLIISVGIFVTFGCLAAFGTIGFVISAIFFLASIIFVIIKFDRSSGNIHFNDDNVSCLLKGTQDTFHYSDISIIKIVNPFRNRAYVEIVLNEKKFTTDIERTDGKDVIKKDFIRFLFDKNPQVTVFEHSNFQKFKYFILRDEVHVVEI